MGDVPGYLHKKGLGTSYLHPPNRGCDQPKVDEKLKFVNFSTTRGTPALHLWYTSVTSPLHLHYISITSPLHLHYISITSPLHLRYISITSPLHLRYT